MLSMSSVLQQVLIAVILAVLPQAIAFAFYLFKRLVATIPQPTWARDLQLQDELERFVSMAVAAAESAFSGSDGAAKREIVQDWIKAFAARKGITLTDSELRAYLEAAVTGLKLGMDMGPDGHAAPEGGDAPAGSAVGSPDRGSDGTSGSGHMGFQMWR